MRRFSSFSVPAWRLRKASQWARLAARTSGAYNVVQSWEFGYRLADVGGNRGKYEADVNYRNGFSLLGSSLTANSRDGHGRFFDEFVLTTRDSATILINPPRSAAEERLYRYDCSGGRTTISIRG